MSSMDERAGEAIATGEAVTTGDPVPPAGDPSATGLAPPGNDLPAASYEAAAARVEEIIRRLDSGEASLQETLQLLGEGKVLIERCAAELRAVGDALQELHLDELVSRLEEEAGG